VNDPTVRPPGHLSLGLQDSNSLEKSGSSKSTFCLNVCGFHTYYHTHSNLNNALCNERAFQRFTRNQNGFSHVVSDPGFTAPNIPSMGHRVHESVCFSHGRHYVEVPGANS
jgi:hypothetical protein